MTTETIDKVDVENSMQVSLFDQLDLSAESESESENSLSKRASNRRKERDSFQLGRFTQKVLSSVDITLELDAPTHYVDQVKKDLKHFGRLTRTIEALDQRIAYLKEEIQDYDGPTMAIAYDDHTGGGSSGAINDMTFNEVTKRLELMETLNQEIDRRYKMIHKRNFILSSLKLLDDVEYSFIYNKFISSRPINIEDISDKCGFHRSSGYQILNRAIESIANYLFQNGYIVSGRKTDKN